MMRFTQLPPGSQFEYQQERYSKTGPLTAVNLADNRQRMIPRSALVAPLAAETGEPVATEQTGEPLSVEIVLQALEHYHNRCLELLQSSEASLDAATLDQLQQELESARQRFLADVGLRNSSST